MAKRKADKPGVPTDSGVPAKGADRRAPAPSSPVPTPLEDRLQYHFRDKALLELALTHRSVAEEQGRNETDADNEQLEFLGDSILDLHVTELLLERFGHRREGDLTRMRAMLVSREALSQVGVRLQLGEALRLGADLEATGGRQKTSLLANAVEAVLAAIYRDAAPDGHLAVAPLIRREIFEPHLPDLLRIAEDGANFGIMGDWKSALQELLQARGVGVPTYRNAAELGETQADRRFVEEVLLGEQVLGRGEARNRKAAQKAAAAEAFRLLQAEPLTLAAAADSATGREQAQ
ncbi:ribonuclease III [Terriglobus aquaticus]|uniref:Ribonuclease 3 n=1 Tax=Terriglobus aquaticus TaxID=940139 RepID=A0ABW9KMJ2_9BACT|nr:ribonuclease III [Terriglobus aquaticus]